jgi:hypothetical protein
MAREETLAEVWYNVGTSGTCGQLFYSILAMAPDETLSEVWYNVVHLAQ